MQPCVLAQLKTVLDAEPTFTVTWCDYHDSPLRQTTLHLQSKDIPAVALERLHAAMCQHCTVLLGVVTCSPSHTTSTFFLADRSVTAPVVIALPKPIPREALPVAMQGEPAEHLFLQWAQALRALATNQSNKETLVTKLIAQGLNCNGHKPPKPFDALHLILQHLSRDLPRPLVTQAWHDLRLIHQGMLVLV